MPEPSALAHLLNTITEEAADLDVCDWWHAGGGWQAFARACAPRDGAFDAVAAERWRDVVDDFTPPYAFRDPDQVRQRQRHAVSVFLAAAEALSNPSIRGLPPTPTDELPDSVAATLDAVPDRWNGDLDAAEQALYGAGHVWDVARLLLDLRLDPETSLRALPDQGRRVLFPIVFKDPDRAPEICGVHATPQTKGEPGAFVAAENAFTALDLRFRTALSRVGPALNAADLQCGPTRVHLFTYGDRRHTEGDAVTSMLFGGPSVGGAAALACHFAHSKTPFEDRGWVVSFGLGDGDGLAHPVGSVPDKESVVAAGLAGVLYGEFPNGLTRALVFDRNGHHASALSDEQLTLRSIVEAVTGRLRAIGDWMNTVLYDVRHQSMHLADAAGRPRTLPDVYVQVRIARRRIAETYLLNPLDGAADPERAYDPDYLRGDPAELENETCPVLMDWPDFARGRERGPTYKRRGVILGEPGYGKSWLLRSEARRLARDVKATLGSGGALPPLPVFATLTQVAECLQNQGGTPGRVPRALADAVNLQIRNAEQNRLREHPGSAQAGSSGLSDLARAEIIDALTDDALGQRLGDEPRRVVLLLDSLDEVPASLVGNLPELWQWLASKPGLPVWVTSRPVGYSGLGTWSLSQPDPDNPNAQDSPDVEIELCVFTKPQQAEFIQKWFADPSEKSPASGEGAVNPHASALTSAIEASPQLQGMAQVPLLLTFLCLLAEADKEDLTSLTRAQLYDKVIHQMIVSELFRRLYRPFNEGERKRGERREGRFIREIRLQLEAPSFSLFTGAIELFHPTTIEEPFEAAPDQVPTPTTQGMDTTMFDTGGLGFPQFNNGSGLGVEDLPLIASVDGRQWNNDEAVFRFIHRTFHEYLAGAFLATVIQRGRQGDEPRSTGWDTKIYAWQEILNEDGLPKKLEKGAPFTDAWQVVHVPVWRFVAKKAWDPRYKQPLLFLAGQIDHPNDKAELLDIVAFAEGGTVDGEKVKGEEDDLFRHRLALAAQMVPEIVPQGIESWDDYDLGDPADDPS